MSKFVDLGVSVFDDDFTLNPYTYLEALYDRDDVLGFRADGMNFLFRFDQCRAVMFNRHCSRSPGDSIELQTIEQTWAQRYPNRAWHFRHSYTHGVPNMTFKAAVGRFIAEVAGKACFDDVEPIFKKLSRGGVLHDYISDISQLPMRVFLETCLIPYNDTELNRLHRAGCAFLKSLENYFDETLVKECDAGLLTIRQFMEQHFHQLDQNSPLQALIAAGRESGMSDEQLIANIGGTFLTSISNTVGISSAFILRTLINDKHSWQLLKDNPEHVHNDNVIMELLRRDNHVKALSRQVDQPFELGRFAIEQGELLYLFFPGINMDPMQWHNPLQLDFERSFSGENAIIFGGSFYTCIGKKLTMAFLKKTINGFIRYLPDTAAVIESAIEMDGSWTAERIINRMPIRL